MFYAGGRKKMISLRLSEEEYELLKTKCRAHGARNMSDLARLAIQLITHGPIEPQNGLAAKLALHDQRLDALESQIALVMERDKLMSCR